MFPHGESVDVLTAGTVVDPYSGETVADWDNSVTVTIPNVAVAMGGSMEPVEVGRNRLEADYDLLFPPDVTVPREARVIVRGDTCEIVGKPFHWHHPMTGWEPGVFAQAKLQEG